MNYNFTSQVVYLLKKSHPKNINKIESDFLLYIDKDTNILKIELSNFVLWFDSKVSKITG
jgi:hypothetical protein